MRLLDGSDLGKVILLLVGTDGGVSTGVEMEVLVFLVERWFFRD